MSEAKFKIGETVSIKLFRGVSGKITNIEYKNESYYYTTICCSHPIHEDQLELFGPNHTSEQERSRFFIKSNSIQEIAKQQWDICENNNWHNKTTLESLALIASEVGEAVNECRGEVPSSNFKIELIDILLRTLDLCVSHNIDIEATLLQKIYYNSINGTRGRIK